MNVANRYDIIVYGGTPGGIGAAIASARQGRRTLLLEPSPYLGGLMTSGLGRTDIISLSASGAVYREFAHRVLTYYTETYGPDSDEVKACRGGMFFEPSVSKKLLGDMLAAEPLLQVHCRVELLSAALTDNRVTAIEVKAEGTAESQTLHADVFIDGTYEGDLAAAAGVPYAIGRESREQWNEEYAGKLYMDFSSKTKEVFPGSTGEGDRRVQAYNYRLCMTNVPANRAPVTRPASYSRDDYASLIGDVREGRVRSIRDVFNILPVPGGKTDSNNHHFCMCSSDLPEENNDYPEASRAERKKMEKRHREYVQGLFWFTQNDPELPASFREEASEWGYAADEFTDTDHFPPQIYVREGRRILGEYTFTENDARLAPGLGRAPIQFDSIAVGAYPIDSHAVRKREPEGQNLALEGFLGLGWITEIYQIPYGIIVPQQVEGLLVPVALSATHMGFGTLRMEPCWMQLGYAAGVAADLSIRTGASIRAVQIDRLQDELLRQDQLITYFKDIDPTTSIGRACQYFGAKGFFTDYEAKANEPITVAEASRVIALSRMLPGGGRLPVLPASPNVLPVGTDMGPRIPMKEPLPKQHWAQHPELTAAMARSWLKLAASRLEVVLPEQEGSEESVTKGQFLFHVYSLVMQQRQR